MPRLATALILLLAGLTAPALAAQPAGRPAMREAPRPAHVVPFALDQGLIFVEVGGERFARKRFAVDTGAQVTHLTAELAAEAGLPLLGQRILLGSGPSAVEARSLPPLRLLVGGMRVLASDAIAAPAEPAFGALYRTLGRRFDGILGYSLFAAWVVEIDYEARELRFYDRASYGAPPEGALPLRIVDRHPYVDATMWLADGSALPANLEIDTGSANPLSFTAQFAAATRLSERVGPTLGSATKGVGGTATSLLARVRRLDLGALAIERPIAAVQLVPGAAPVPADGRIGGDILRRFTVTLDYAGGWIRFAPNAAFGEPFETDMSGITLAASPSALAVTGVLPGTAGADAGLRVGDRIVAIDGRAPASFSLADIRAAMRGDGAVRMLSVRRGAALLTVALRLKRRL
jgi:hypothetical protein